MYHQLDVENYGVLNSLRQQPEVDETPKRYAGRYRVDKSTLPLRLGMYW